MKNKKRRTFLDYTTTTIGIVVVREAARAVFAWFVVGQLKKVYPLMQHWWHQAIEGIKDFIGMGLKEKVIRKKLTGNELIKEFLNRNWDYQLKIHCVGDAMIDEYYKVRVDRISPEFPMPIMSSGNHMVSRPGGVANVAYQFHNFNASVDLVCLMYDIEANRVFREHGINIMSTYGQKGNCRLPKKSRFLADKIQIARYDHELDLCGLTQEELDHSCAYIWETISESEKPDVAILSDYDKGFFVSERFALEDYYDGVITIVDPKKEPLEKWRGCTVFKPNAKEAYDLSGLSDWRDQAAYFKDKLHCEAVVITYGGEKVCGLDKEGYFVFNPDTTVDAESVIGAGDTFCAFLGMALGQGFSVTESAEIAWRAGSVYVQGSLNRPIVPAELNADKIVCSHDLIERDFKLVFTNGCFDLLHSGHLETLRFAKKQGDKLVVAINSDSSVEKIKGESRPIKPLKERMAVMAAIDVVDFVVYFDEYTPYGVINTIRPDVLVKGGDDYNLENIVGADIVPEVIVAPPVDGLATSNFLERI